MGEKPHTEQELYEMEDDPRKAAFYYSDRARYARLRAARIRGQKAKGFDTSGEHLPADAWDILADVLNDWAEREIGRASE